MSSLFTQEETVKVLKSTDTLIENERLRALFNQWIHLDGLKAIIQSREHLMQVHPKRGNKKFQITIRYATILTAHVKSLSDLNWKSYCKVMHDITAVKTLALQSPLREMHSNFYKSILQLLPIREKIKELQRFSDLFLPTEIMQDANDTDPLILRNVRTYFPLESTPEQIVQAECESGRTGNVFIANFFIHTDVPFLRDVMEGFIQHLSQDYSTDKQSLNTISYRLFFIYFANSLQGEVINSPLSFNQSTFQKQLDYLKLRMEEHEPTLSYTLLVKFYRYIDDLFYEMNGKRLFNSLSFNRDLFANIYYQSSLKEGYEFVAINPLEEIPLSDKWYVVGTTTRSTHVSSNKNAKYDFTQIKDTGLRNDLKKYVWNWNYATPLSQRFSYLVDFLNASRDYYDKQLKVSYINDKHDVKLFSNEFLLFHYANIVSNQQVQESTIRQRIHGIRAFLHDIQQKYSISEVSINQFSSIDRNDKGGTPITEDDFQLILKSFEDRNSSQEGELLLIAFQLSMETKLRIGEVMSLQRDCIISINEQSGYGIVRYYNKTSHGQAVNETFLLHHIRLIQRAIELSQTAFEMANAFYIKYIFIGFHKKYKNQIVNLNHRYKNVFREINISLHEQGKIQRVYHPYNARHTFIDNAWQMVENGQVSTLEVGVITGNSAEVAHKHYRNRDNTKRYVEALWEVSVPNVINGQIVENEDLMGAFSPIQENAGACSSEECIKVNVDEDSFYKCLTCKKFVTTTERSSVFEERLKEFKSKRENSQTIAERNYYIGLIELYSAYLVEMYSIMEDRHEQ